MLTPLLTGGPGRGMIVNLSVDTSSADLMDLCKDIDAHYIDTVCEPWPGLYTDRSLSISQRSNYALREGVLDVRRRRPGGVTAVSCCGANPGMVSWMVKQALVNLAADLKLDVAEPRSREEWALLAQRLGVKGIHIAERDTQRARTPKPRGKFVNTWSVEGFIAEGLQPSELGWGTHEKALPAGGARHDFGCDAAIYLKRPGAGTRVRSWTPTAQAQHAWMITHNEFDLDRRLLHGARRERQGGLPADLPLRLSPVRRRGAVAARDGGRGLEAAGGVAHPDRGRHRRRRSTSSACCSTATPRTPTGTARSSRSRRRARLAPYQNATGLQVTSAVLAGIVWMLENPDRGLVEADEMDFRRCLEIQRPYLGPVTGHYTDWTPLKGRGELFPEDVDSDDPWQFRNVLVA